MHLTPTERDRLLLFGAAELARRRLRDGVLLNVPESIALICDAVLEQARRGARHAEAMYAGQHALHREQVLPDVPRIVQRVSVEAVFTDGSRLVVVTDPFGPAEPSAPLAAAEPSAPLAAAEPSAPLAAAEPSAPAHVHDVALPADDVVSQSFSSADGVTVEVLNTAPVAVSVTSHFHFFETNPRLRFDRAAAYGMHLAVPAGTHVRFEPGVPREVRLRPIAGRRVVIGMAGLVDGPLDAPGARDLAVARARACGFLDVSDTPGTPDGSGSSDTAGGSGTTDTAGSSATGPSDPDGAAARALAIARQGTR